MKRLLGKVAIITGAAGGIGAATAKLFAAEGARVVVTDIQPSGIKETAAGIGAVAVVHDVSSESDWAEVVRVAVEQYGTINILVNNAGIYSDKSIANESVDVWDRIQAVNVRSVFLGMKHVVPYMKQAGGGSIVNISSIFGLIGTGGYAAYTASKGAVRALTKTAAIEFANDHIRVNSIFPGTIATPMTQSLLDDSEMLKFFQSATPLPRLGKPDDIAYGALYLASDESSFVTGSELVIDGGWTVR